MTIAGSDSGGGAGIQADLKTFAALGVYGTSAITALTAQNTVGVSAILEVDPQMVAAQIDAIVSDIRPDAVKTGMLASAPIIQVVAAKIREHSLANVVVDPVMVAKSGDRLLQEAAVEALRHDLLPLAAVVTPNLPEAEVLVGKAIESDEDVREAAQAIVGLGARAAVVKGGHRAGQEHAIDVLYDGARFHVFSAPRIDTTNTHGTGCTFASAIAAFLACGNPLPEAVGLAKAYLTEALQHAYPLGAGHGPVHHFYRFWQT
ncbi:MAG TPA: bifunctional hydroxymethylpyrimidine kinase/phosphomethylpyrimidine kinase [Dehalococcoidia bacterium]|nr:bifunctional hydroxymethylpyrimidine kinase/phosphomethylpyrimidine kinase [Dehalococcoidia bacterium]